LANRRCKQEFSSSGADVVNLFTSSGNIYIALCASTGSTAMMSFDSASGLFAPFSLLLPVDPLTRVDRLLGFDAQGTQWLVTASRVATAGSFSSVVVYLNDTLLCTNTSNCSMGWSAIQKISVSGYIAATEVCVPMRKSI
jgi:hypothetical protein